MFAGSGYKKENEIKDQKCKVQRENAKDLLSLKFHEKQDHHDFFNVCLHYF